MFAANHYVPILRYKDAERNALRKLFPKDRANITPLIEVLPRSFAPRRRGREQKPIPRNADAVVKEIARELSVAWGRAPLFVDLMHLKSDFRIGGRFPWEELSVALDQRKVHAIPVTGIREEEGQRSAIRAAVGSRGACVRLKQIDLEKPDLHDDLRRLLTDLKTKPEKTDLLVDFEEFYDGAPDYGKICELLPVISRWRTFTVASGAFIPDLTGIKAGEKKELRRSDWHRWVQQSAQPTLPRRPSFSDYSVQFARHKEAPLGAKVSASVRYALPRKWLILRGEWLHKENGPGYKQYTMWARVLCKMKNFCGEQFSAGDAYIAERATDEAHTGGPTQWLFAAHNHHITLTVRQIRKLSAI